VSRKRATTAPIAREESRDGAASYCEVETGFEPVYTALQAVASPLGHSTVRAAGLHREGEFSVEARSLRADNRARTGDLNLGKVALYQLSYVRVV
jgi:hypothetical protein